MPAGKAIRLWNTGQSWKLFDLGVELVERYGSPYITIHRGDLHGVIAQALLREKPDAIHLGCKCIGLSQTPERVELFFDTAPPVAAELVIGADGVHSVVREHLFGAAEPQFTGIIAWRGIVPIERVPPTIAWNIGTNWIGPGGHAVHYPLRAGKLLNVVGLRERSDWTVEGWNVRGTTEEVLNDFRGWHADLLELFCNIDVPYKWALGVAPDHAGMEQRPLHAARRRLPSDGAVPGARRGHGDRGRFRAGAVPGKISGRSRNRVCALRSGPPRPRQQGRDRLG